MWIWSRLSHSSTSDLPLMARLISVSVICFAGSAWRALKSNVEMTQIDAAFRARVV